MSRLRAVESSNLRLEVASTVYTQRRRHPEGQAVIRNFRFGDANERRDMSRGCCAFSSRRE